MCCTDVRRRFPYLYNHIVITMVAISTCLVGDINIISRPTDESAFVSYDRRRYFHVTTSLAALSRLRFRPRDLLARRQIIIYVPTMQFSAAETAKRRGDDDGDLSIYFRVFLSLDVPETAITLRAHLPKHFIGIVGSSRVSIG